MGRSIGELIEAKADRKLRDEVSRSIPGIGPRASRTLPGPMPELVELTGKQASAMRFEPGSRASYKRPRANGEAAKVAIARKLLTVADAMIRDVKPWTPPMTCGAA